jgi:hypothetical protein
VRINTGVVSIFVLAVVLAFLPPLTDRWALRRGASPEALVALALVTLAGVVAVPVAFVLCTAGAAGSELGHGAPSAVGVAGLLLVAIAAGRTLARAIAIRRRWRSIARLAATLELPTVSGGVRVLPVDELLAFAAGTEAFVSRGLMERLTPAARRAVIEHEREHASRGHTRLVGAGRALAHGSFHLLPARRAVEALDRELDALADRAAARRVRDPRAVRAALHATAAASADEMTAHDEAAIPHRIERLTSCEASRQRLVDGAVRVVTLGLGALVLAVICLSVHTSIVWLGAAACALLTASLVAFARPAFIRRPLPLEEEAADGSGASTRRPPRRQ